MDDLPMLPKEVRDAIEYCDDIFDDADNGEWAVIRAELQRAIVDRERAEAERDTLRKRMSSAPTCNVRLHAGFPVIDVHDVVCHDAKYMERWMRVSLVPLDDAEAQDEC